MSNRVCNFSDLVQRVTANCLLHPLGNNRFDRDQVLSPDHSGESEDEDPKEEAVVLSEYESGEDNGGGEEERKGGESLEGHNCKIRWKDEKGREMEAAVALMGQVFEAAAAMKRAYAGLQEAHCPWDPAKMKTADEAVVAELRRIGLLRERFKRGFAARGGSRRTATLGGAAMREVVAPYEAAVVDLKREVKAKDMEIESLRERLKSVTVAGGRKGRFHSKRKVNYSQSQVPLSPSPDLFEATMSLVRETSKSFAGLLLSLMRSAHWDIAAAVRSIESATTTAASPTSETLTPTASSASSSPTGPHHSRYALESYVTRKLFQGFDHETFYMDGTLLSLLNPDQFRRDCFSKYRDMKSMDPTELLGVTPTCHFGVFCSKKYLSIMHPKMEESLFGDLDHRHRVSAGDHPRTAFYAEFLAVSKAVWLLHLLAFSLDPAPSHFEATRGAEFHPVYMESVAKFPSGKVPPGQVVGLPVSPGFKLGSGSIIKARVYLVNRN
ncbi:hypothetical protein V2J09_019081 [Rumex salicifolius]